GSGAVQTTPVRAAPGVTFTSLPLGGTVSCGITTSSATVCWGGNLLGQLGDGRSSPVNSPTPGRTTRAFRAVTSEESSSCGLDASGAAWCWGKNSFGQLGSGDLLSHDTAVAVAGGRNFAS